MGEENYGRWKKMKEIHQEFLTGERALFQGKDLKIYDTILTTESLR